MSIKMICEVLGTVAFAISGAMLAIDRKMDIFGVMVLGVVTSLGGGLMRDIILNISPPSMFVNPSSMIIALLVSFYTFCVVHSRRHMLPMVSEEKFHWVLNFTDAIGLGLFTAIGVSVAHDSGYGTYDMFGVFLGMLTGVGGGMIRDILAGLTPAILVKNVYACASLIGAVCCQLLLRFVSEDYAMFFCAMLVIAVRMAAYHWKWDLPKAV